MIKCTHKVIKGDYLKQMFTQGTKRLALIDGAMSEDAFLLDVWFVRGAQELHLVYLDNALGIPLADGVDIRNTPISNTVFKEY